jgi:hypothetical protein
VSGGTTSDEQISGHRIDCGAFGVNAMMNDNDDDFNNILNVSAQDKMTRKSSEMPGIQCAAGKQGIGSLMVQGLKAKVSSSPMKSCTPPNLG